MRFSYSMKKLTVVFIVFLVLLVFASGCIDKPEDECEAGGDAPPLTSSDSNAKAAAENQSEYAYSRPALF